MNSRVNDEWQPISTAPSDHEVWTKIHDDHGERNVAKLTLKGRLWFTQPTGGMYVYYAPTHWKPVSVAPKALVDMWPVRCAHCLKSIGATNGNAGIEVAIYCSRCEPEFIKEADEMIARLGRN